MSLPASSAARAGREWLRAGVFEVAPGVHRVPLPIPDAGLGAVNVYVLTTADGFVIVDSGWAIPDARRLLEEALRTLGGSLHDVREFLVTHVHRDHYAQAIQLRRQYALRISLGAGEKATIAHALAAGADGMAAQLAHLRRLGGDDLVDAIEVEIREQSLDACPDWDYPDDWLVDGQEVAAGPARRLHVVETPGHTQGHVVLHDLVNELLFAGDHVLPSITPSIGFEPLRSEDPLGAFLRSLAVVRARPDAMLLPAHGDCMPSVHTRVDELIAHHASRLDETERAVSNGAATGWEVARRLHWTRRGVSFDDLSPFNQMLALSETGAHLDLLQAQGRVSRDAMPPADLFAYGPETRGLSRSG